ncbi:MAG: hypothetical protein ACRDPD_24300 [Streptosporangiaceae bacterium]
MNRTPLPDEPPLTAALRACADGFYPAEAAAEFLIGHASWLYRDDFRDGFVDVGTCITDGTTLMAVIDWPAAITALNDGGLPSSGGERRVLRLAASLADGIPVDLRDAFTGMDAVNVDRAVRAMLHAPGRRPGRHWTSGRPGCYRHDYWS